MAFQIQSFMQTCRGYILRQDSSRYLFFLSVCLFFGVIPIRVDTSLFVVIMTALGIWAWRGSGAFGEVMRSPARYAIWGYLLFGFAALAGTVLNPESYRYYLRVVVWGACAFTGIALSRCMPQHNYAFFWGTLAGLCLSFLGACILVGFNDPSLWHEERLKLFAVHPVRLGLYCSVTFLFCLNAYGIAKTRLGMGFCAAAVLFSGWLTYLTNTRGIILLLPLAVLGIAWTLPRKNLLRFAVAVGVVVALCITGAVMGKSSFTGGRLVSAITNTTEDSTFKTRLPIWEAAWEAFKDSPVVGHGVASFTKLHRKYLLDNRDDWDVRYNRLYEERAKHTHNFTLGRMVDSGIIGTAGFFLFYGLAIIAAWRGPKEGRWVTSLLVFYMLSMQFDDGFSRINDALIMITAGSALGIPRTVREKGEPDAVV